MREIRSSIWGTLNLKYLLDLQVGILNRQMVMHIWSSREKDELVNV